MIAIEDLYKTPNGLASYYENFDVAGRVLLTGHSHQAWPDVGYAGQKQAWLDAARYVDDKWELAFERADSVRRGFANLIDGAKDNISLDVNTHALVVRFLSSLPFQTRPKLITTDGEFHTIRRQLDRLSEEGVEVIKVPASPADMVAEKIIQQIDDTISAVLVSSVLFQSGKIVPGLKQILDACQLHGAELLVDVYHSLNVVPFSIREEQLEGAFIVGGGYKYCQLGEGNCFLRVPDGRTFRPVITGWFAEFEHLEKPDTQEQVKYGAGGDAFNGATYDPTSHYRAAEVFRFFLDMGLPPAKLRAVSQHQIGLLTERFDQQDIDPKIISRDQNADLIKLGGFLTLESHYAQELTARLRDKNVMVDHRGNKLRLGPAPYLSDEQLELGIAALAECIKEVTPPD